MFFKIVICALIVIGCVATGSQGNTAKVKENHDIDVRKGNTDAFIAVEVNERVHAKLVGAIIKGVFAAVAVGVGIACIFVCSKKEPEPSITCHSPNPPDIYIPKYARQTDVQWSVNHKGKLRGAAQSGKYRKGQYAELYVSSMNSLERHCSVSFTVHLTECNRPQNPNDGTFVCSGDSQYTEIVWGETCSFSCRNGYELDAPPTIECGEDGQFTSSRPNCKKKLCPPPEIKEHSSINCKNGHEFQAICEYRCDKGHAFSEETKYTAITCQGDQTWSSDPPVCVDNEPPEIYSCPTTFSVYTNRLSKYGYATWNVPTANDTKDGEIPVVQESGLEPGSMFPIGETTISYSAADLQGNTAFPCIFEIIVQERSCPPYPYTPKLNVTCYGAIWGSHCDLNCNNGYPLMGPDKVFCEEDLAKKLMWDWGEDQPFCQVLPCHDLDPPLNGALSCSTWTHGRHCQMLCNAKYDIPRTVQTSGEWVCDDTQGEWSPSADVPHCTGIRRPGSMLLPSHLFYFSGDCTSNETVDEIKSNFLDHLSQSNYKTLCVEYPECTASNVEVTCGPISRNKRAALGFRIDINFNFEIELIYPSNFSTDDYNSLLNSVDSQFDAMADQFQTDISTGIMDLEISNLETQIDPNSFTYDWSDMVCQLGMVPRLSTFSCASCPPGTKYSIELNECEQCPVGQYQDEDGQSQCKQCPELTSTLEIGSISSHKCIALCDYGFYSDTGMESCVPCPVGTYQDAMGGRNCTICQDGKTTVSTGSNSAVLCLSNDELGSSVACNTSICNGGYCLQDANTTICFCNGGYTGDFCEVPPNPCNQHVCQNGAPCQADGTDDYICLCTEDHIGTFCQEQIVNGGFNNWRKWSECSKSCGGGVRTRVRPCDKPPRGPNGKDCEGVFTEEQDCNRQDCPSCGNIEFPDRYVHNCTTVGEETMCDVRCADGYELATNHLPTVTCGLSTDYTWSFGYSDPKAELPKCTAATIAENVDIQFKCRFGQLFCSAVEKIDTSALTELVNHNTDCENIDGCEMEITNSCQKESTSRKKRDDTPFAFIIEMSGHVENGNYFKDGHYDQAAAAAAQHQFTTLVNDFNNMGFAVLQAVEDGDFNVTVDGQVFTPTLEAYTDLECPEGMVYLNGYCINCPVGSKQDASSCQPCAFGYYQDTEGQTECIECPPDHTTDTQGSTSVDDCVSTKSDEEENEAINSTGTPAWIIGVSVCVAVGVVSILSGIAVYKFSRKKAVNKVDPSTVDLKTLKDNPPSYSEAMNNGANGTLPA